MEKKRYEGLKELTKKVNDGTATFKERNVYNVIQKRRNKGQQIHFEGEQEKS